VFDQAENRMHAQKAVLVELLNPEWRKAGKSKPPASKTSRRPSRKPAKRVRR
jgi:hypothetical protein